MKYWKIITRILLVIFITNIVMTVYGDPISETDLNTTQSLPKKVAYVTLGKTMHETAATVEDEAIIRMLNADPNIDLDVIVTTSTGTVDLSGYDAVIVQESIGGNDGIIKPTGSLAIKDIPVPFIFNKSYGFTNNRVVGGTSGTSASEARVLDIYVSPENQGNDLFKGIRFEDNKFPAFKGFALDNGAASDNVTGKSLNYATGLAIDPLSPSLANPDGIEINVDNSLFINDLPAGTNLNSQVLTSRMITIGMNFGAISRDNGENMTPEGLTLWRNAVYTLTGIPVPNHLVGFEPKKVAYVTLGKTMHETAATVEDEAIIRMLNTDPNIDLDVIVTTSTGTVDLSGYDAVIVQESIGGNDGIIKPTGSLAIKDIPVPFIFNKSYGFTNNRVVGGTSGTSASEARVLDIYVSPENQGNDLFKGIRFEDNKFPAFKGFALDNGAASDNVTGKSLNYATGLAIDPLSPSLANPDGIEINVDNSLFINDLPAGTNLNSQVLTSRMITIGMNFGAISRDNGENMTPEGLTLWRNAVYTLTGIPVPNYPYGEDGSLSSDAALLSITWDGNEVEDFDPDDDTYQVTLPSGFTTVTVDAVTRHSNATFSGGGVIDISSGSETVVLEVTAENGTTKSYTIHFTVQQPKKVAYFTLGKTMHETAATVEDEAIIRMLNADPNIDLDVIVTTSTGEVDFEGYDAVIVQESFGGNDAIIKPTGALAIKDIPVPFIFNKSFGFTNNRVVGATSGTSASEARVLDIHVSPENQGNEIFKSISFEDDKFPAFKGFALDNGAASDNVTGKSFNYATGLTISPLSPSLANPDGIEINVDNTLFINDIPAGTDLNSQVLTSRMINIGMNFGAISSNNGENMTPEGLTLWRNALYILTGLPVPDYQVGFEPITKVTDPSPAHGEEGLAPEQVELSWEGRGAVYHLLVGTASDNLELVSDQITDKNYTLTALTPSTTYYWRIDAVDGDENLAIGDVWSFTTSIASKTSNPAPATGSDEIDYEEVLLTWSGASNSYKLYLGTSEGNLNLLSDNLEETSFAHSGLNSSQTYYWRVDAVAIGGLVTEGDVWSFTTRAPYKVTGPSPANESSDIEEEVVLSWSGEAPSYKIYIGTTYGQQDFVAEVTENSYQVTGLEPSTAYFWRVDAIGHNDDVTTGDLWFFVTYQEVITGLQSGKGYQDLSVYPNPFKNEINLELELNKAEDIQVNIYNITGALIYNKTISGLRQGVQRIKIDESDAGFMNLNKGVYMCVLQTSDAKKVTRIIKN